MGKILTTELHSFFSHKFINQNERNYQIIDNWLSDFKNEIEDHIKNQNPAHDATQIKYEAGSVSEFLEYLNGRFSNMILGHNGNGINEVTDARVDNNGVAHATLQDRLRNDNIYYKEKIKTINEEVTENYKEFQENEYRFDPKEQEMQFITDLSPYYNAVMQSFWVDPNTHIIYMTQAHGNRKDYILTRMKPNGQFIDRLIVKKGGHGTHNAYRYINGVLWIYSSIVDENGKRRFVRFRYKSGELKYGADTIDVLPNYTYDRYVTAIYNPTEDLFILRFADNDIETQQSKFKNRLEFIEAKDVDGNNPVPKYKFNIPLEYTSVTQPFQGMTYDEGIIYIYTGDSDPSVDNLLTAFDVKTSEKLWSRPVYIGGVNDSYNGNFQEAEGISMYYDKETDRKAILLGVTTGIRNNRHHSIYSVGQRGVNEILKNRTAPVLMTDTGGRVKTVPNIDSPYLSDTNEVGHYYLYTADTHKMKDFPLPDSFKDAGWFLDVYPGHYKGALRQVLTRNSVGRNMLKFERIISVFDRKENGLWNYIPETAGFWERIPTSYTRLKDLDFAGMSFYITKEDSERFTDFPKSLKGVAGWTLDIEQVSENVKRQVLKRYNTNASYQFLVRTLSPNGISKWALFEGKEID